jgi:hypothetical protein
MHETLLAGKLGDLTTGPGGDAVAGQLASVVVGARFSCRSRQPSGVMISFRPPRPACRVAVEPRTLPQDSPVGDIALIACFAVSWTPAMIRRWHADPFGFLRPWNEVPALMGSAPPATPPSSGRGVIVCLMG